MELQENSVNEVEKESEVALEEVAQAGEFASFDDVAEREREEQDRAKKIEDDKLLPPDPEAILEVRHLKKHFVLKKTLMGTPLSTLKAVDDVSFKV